eukprot:Nk52_evm3s311 gene=Nk52_evmTU3s311
MFLVKSGSAVRGLAAMRTGKNSLGFQMSAAYATKARKEFKDILTQEIEDIKKAGTFKVERVITSRQNAVITVEGGQQVINFCANNYLGLSGSDEMVNAAADALYKRGSGLSSVRFICGLMDIHAELEDKISKFHQTEDTILFPSCFDANAGLFEVIMGENDALFSDELNHASIIDGIRLCKKPTKYRYKHRDMADLEEGLRQNKDKRLKLIVTDGVFSMDGNIAPLKEICDLAEEYNALTFIDECHATGFLGKTGRGTDEHCGVFGRVDIINSTLGKALGGASGGYTTGPKELITILKQKARPYLFSNSIAPPVVGAANKVFDMLLESSQLAEQVQENTKYFRSEMTKNGFKLMGDPLHPIAPVWIGDAKTAVEFADEMLKRGVYVIGFSYPVVPKGKARIRVQISAAHTKEHLDKAVAAFTEVAKMKGVI